MRWGASLSPRRGRGLTPFCLRPFLSGRIRIWRACCHSVAGPLLGRGGTDAPYGFHTSSIGIPCKFHRIEAFFRCSPSLSGAGTTALTCAGSKSALRLAPAGRGCRFAVRAWPGLQPPSIDDRLIHAVPPPTLPTELTQSYHPQRIADAHLPPRKLFCVMADKCVPTECLLAMSRLASKRI